MPGIQDTFSQVHLKAETKRKLTVNLLSVLSCHEYTMLILDDFNCSLSFSWNIRCFSEEKKSKCPETCLFKWPLSFPAKIDKATSFLKDCRKFADFLFFKKQNYISFSYYKKKKKGEFIWCRDGWESEAETRGTGN